MGFLLYFLGFERLGLCFLDYYFVISLAHWAAALVFGFYYSLCYGLGLAGLGGFGVLYFSLQSFSFGMFIYIGRFSLNLSHGVVWLPLCQIIFLLFISLG